jgi:hypothetical protein
MRVAIYARVSTDDKGQDPENQLRQLREWCATCDHTIVNEYVDYESGRKADREQFNLLFQDAHNDPPDDEYQEGFLGAVLTIGNEVLGIPSNNPIWEYASGLQRRSSHKKPKRSTPKPSARKAKSAPR